MSEAVGGSVDVVHAVEGNLNNLIVLTLALQTAAFLLRTGFWLEALTNSLISLFVVMWLRRKLAESPPVADGRGRHPSAVHTLYAYAGPALEMARYFLSILFVYVANDRLLVYASDKSGWRNAVPDQVAVLLILFSAVFVLALWQQVSHSLWRTDEERAAAAAADLSGGAQGGAGPRSD
jgi:hypothetical protein